MFFNTFQGRMDRQCALNKRTETAQRYNFMCCGARHGQDLSSLYQKTG